MHDRQQTHQIEIAAPSRQAQSIYFDAQTRQENITEDITQPEGFVSQASVVVSKYVPDTQQMPWLDQFPNRQCQRSQSEQSEDMLYNFIIKLARVYDPKVKEQLSSAFNSLSKFSKFLSKTKKIRENTKQASIKSVKEEMDRGPGLQTAANKIRVLESMPPQYKRNKKKQIVANIEQESSIKQLLLQHENHRILSRPLSHQPALSGHSSQQPSLSPSFRPPTTQPDNLPFKVVPLLRPVSQPSFHRPLSFLSTVPPLSTLPQQQHPNQQPYQRPYPYQQSRQAYFCQPSQTIRPASVQVYGQGGKSSSPRIGKINFINSHVTIKYTVNCPQWGQPRSYEQHLWGEFTKNNRQQAHNWQTNCQNEKIKASMEDTIINKLSDIDQYQSKASKIGKPHKNVTPYIDIVSAHSKQPPISEQKGINIRSRGQQHPLFNQKYSPFSYNTLTGPRYDKNSPRYSHPIYQQYYDMDIPRSRRQKKITVVSKQLQRNSIQ